MNNNKIEKTPIVEVSRKQPKQPSCRLCCGCRSRRRSTSSLRLSSLMRSAHYMSRDLILGAVSAASIVSFVTIPLSGHILDPHRPQEDVHDRGSDQGVFGFLYFGMVDTAAPVMVFVAIVLSLIPHDMQYGPQAGADRRPYSAPALQRRFAGYRLASVIAGGPAPLIATALFASFHSGYAISIYIAACAVISLVATAMMPDYTGKDISMEYDD